MLAAYGGPALAQGDEAAPLPIRVVVVTMFELGEDQGDRPGELQTWVERLPLPETLPFPQGYRDLRLNREKGVLAIVTGVGTARAAASIMALGMDPRFDLRRAYWLVAGIAGADPDDLSLGSAAWAEWVVDGDLSHEIDPREMPAGWPTGYLPLRHAEPYARPVPEDDEGVVYRLDPDLVDWAYQLTRDVPLEDTAALQALRERYVDHPAAQRPPFVLKGDNLAAMTFWHGRLLNQWANDWIAYWTEGKGNFVTSAMEDSGTLQSLTFLDKAARVDRDRVLVLRTASNYAMQHRGISAAESLSGEKKGQYSAFLPSLEAAWRVGQPVVEELVAHWQRYADTPPGGP
ncbi:MAG: purine nucleoside permease [Geminicoccales bacterium]